ncbi:N-acetylmuramoyl-L-alanine amidase [Pannus brasiliensis CCIBt3594]|uniref:N-acetylmuramoyl-L-alanine amidase n=1 Tax=Pannus brasiliensis CCIBt3594 TaxID=1427578 RepID=A0AAW9QZD7_9CHRO
MKFSIKSFVTGISIGLCLVLFAGFFQGSNAQTSRSLYLAYPSNNHQTVASQIFFIGSAPTTGQVTINNRVIDRSKQGNFAPSFPLQIGDNLFTIRHQNKTVNVKVTRLDRSLPIPKELGFTTASLNPSTDITRLVGEWICFTAIATPNARVSVELGDEKVALLPQSRRGEVPANSAVLTGLNQAEDTKVTGFYRGCKQFNRVADLGIPTFTATLNEKTIRQKGTGEINIISEENLPAIEVISPRGVARTGPSSDHSRLTPLPKGTRASVTGKEGDWLRLDYGGWILAKETRSIDNEVLDTATVSGISSRPGKDATEIIFPLSRPVPIAVRQEDDKFILTLYTSIAKTDTIFIGENPLVRRMDWRQVTPTSVEYTFFLNQNRQWGYDLRYEGSNLVLTLRYPPARGQGLQGTTILLDPGHGGKETGATGPTGYTEKQVNIAVSKLIQRELERLGATVYLTRESDTDLSLPARVDIIDNLKPTLALSVHYNALPDGGDAINTKGIGIFWYHPQAHELAAFLHDYLTKTLKRSSYGVFWNNLALTRPHSAPSILLELGFMSNPDEFEWITDAGEQQKLARAVAEGIRDWFEEEAGGRRQ